MSDSRPTARLSTEGLSRSEVIVLLILAFRKLGWGLEHLHPLRVVANTPPKGFSKGEDIGIDLDDAGITISSKPTSWSPFARRSRHQMNLDRLMEGFAVARVSTAPDVMQAELKELAESGVMDQDASTARANEFHWKDIGTFFIPREGFWATPLLIDASVLVYILMVATGVHFMEPTTEDLLKWGANYRAVTLAGEWWRLLTCCFEHIGLMHLLLNMYALAMVGIYLEPLLGRWRMFTLYAVTGICASLASLWWHENTVSAGASGAIFGLYGVFIALLMTDLIHKDVRKSLLSSMGIFVVYNLVYGLKGGVDNAAHIGGLISGLVIGFSTYLALRKPEQPWLGWLTVAAPSLVLMATGVGVVRSLPADDQVFIDRMEAFQRIEEQGLVAFRMPEGATGEDQLKLLQDSSLPAWRNGVVLLHDLKGLDLSEAMQRRRELLTAYSEERLRNVELLEVALQQGNTALSPELQASFDRVDSVVALLNAE
jgi:rhomboid protease GluP